LTGGRELVLDAAMRIISERGVAALSFREIAKALSLRSPAGPLYHYGTSTALLARVAEIQFDRLTAELDEERRTTGPRLLERIALRYADYALSNPHLYQAIHSPELWSAAVASDGNAPVRGKPAGPKARELTAASIAEARKARNKAFEVFVRAVRQLIRSGELRRACAPADVARMVTALVDGYLFQTFDENVAPDASAKERLEYIGELLDLALSGSLPERSATVRRRAAAPGAVKRKKRSHS
jgi:AcrR family transcriptional regulator